MRKSGDGYSSTVLEFDRVISNLVVFTHQVNGGATKPTTIGLEAVVGNVDAAGSGFEYEDAAAIIATD